MSHEYFKERFAKSTKEDVDYIKPMCQHYLKLKNLDSPTAKDYLLEFCGVIAIRFVYIRRKQSNISLELGFTIDNGFKYSEPIEIEDLLGRDIFELMMLCECICMFVGMGKIEEKYEKVINTIIDEYCNNGLSNNIFKELESMMN